MTCHRPVAAAEAALSFHPQGPAYVRKDDAVTSGSAHHVSGTLIRRWDTNEYFPDTYELYNLSEDKGEANNLALNEHDRVRELDAAIEFYLADSAALRPVPNPAFEPASRKGMNIPDQPDTLFSQEA